MLTRTAYVVNRPRRGVPRQTNTGAHGRCWCGRFDADHRVAGPGVAFRED